VPAKWIALPYTRARRRRLAGATVACVTGSVGKTTTAHLLEAVLGCPANPRPGSNRARAIVRGVRAASVSGFVVQEIGAAGPGTLDELLWALEPDVAVVTAVASDHLGAFRTLEAVEREKAKAVAAVPPGGLAVLNADDPRVLAMRGLCRGRVVTFGESDDADVRIEGIRGGYPEGISFTAVTRDGAFDVRTQLLGRHLAGCAAAAFVCALVLGLDPSRALAALAETAPVPHRLSLLPTSDGPTFLLDDRKASITTVAPGFAALEHATHAGRKVVVLGDVSDTRGSKRKLYRDTASDAREVASLVVVVGRWAHHALRARRAEDDRSIVAFESVPEAADFLRAELRPDDLVLVKGSHVYEHLSRVALQFTRPVRCRRVDCRRRLPCESCSLLERPARRPPWARGLDTGLRSGPVGYGGR
jgi:UDP-N-acetylmuramoyl-tripeptide--D-alanyl-D-alanine ligase